MSTEIIFPEIKPCQRAASYLAKRQLGELVLDAVLLEGIEMTYPEIQTLLDGVSIGGRKISDINITLNQIAAWRFLFESLEKKTFAFSKDFSNEIHAIAAKEEALTWGSFRHAQVSISGTAYLPPDQTLLDNYWDSLATRVLSINHIMHRAMVVFLQMARHQFYFDVNKRTGPFMMNGILLEAGYPVINIPASRQLEFNRLMLDFYKSNNETPMINFMISCYSQQTIDFMNQV